MTHLEFALRLATGACMFVLLSVLTPDEASPTRIAAQVVSGIGFLAGGVILREGLTVRGLNTAAGAVDLRLRAVFMTDFSFILGVLPLLFSSGAGSESQKVIGTTVFSGMLISTALSLIAVPMLFYLVASLTGEKDEAFTPAETEESA